MKPSDVVNQLRRYLPRFTSRFTDTRAANVVVSGGVATATNTLTVRDSQVGDMVVIWDSTKSNSIVSVAKSGTTFLLETASAHGMTQGFTKNATLEGFTEAEWNGDFTLRTVASPTTFTITSNNAAIPSPIDGALVEAGDINGSHAVSAVVDANTITFEVPGVADQTTGATLEFAPRVTAVPTPERLDELYTEQGTDDFWLFVVPGDASVSKDRHVLSDALSARATGDDPRTRLTEPYSLFVVANSTSEISATDMMDICRNDLLGPIFNSIMGVRFEQGVCSNKQFRFMPTGHALALYGDSRYMHQYSFENVFDISAGDEFVPDTVALRDLTLNFNYTGGNTLTAHTELPSS